MRGASVSNSNLTLVRGQELKLVFPGAQRMNRGRHEVGALVRACKANGVTDLLVVHEHRGTPGKAGRREGDLGLLSWQPV